MSEEAYICDRQRDDMCEILGKRFIMREDCREKYQSIAFFKKKNSLATDVALYMIPFWFALINIILKN